MGKDEKYQETFFFFFRKQEANTDLRESGKLFWSNQRCLDRLRRQWNHQHDPEYLQKQREKAQDMVCAEKHSSLLSERDGLQEQWEIEQCRHNGPKPKLDLNNNDGELSDLWQESSKKGDILVKLIWSLCTRID